MIKYNGVENDGRLEEIINPVIENLRSINERNYAFLEVADRKKGVLIYVYLTADNYVVYYKVEDEFEYGITALTDRVKVDVDNGLLFRWNRKRRKYEKADVLKIEKCVLCFFSDSMALALVPAPFAIIAKCSLTRVYSLSLLTGIFNTNIDSEP